MAILSPSSARQIYQAVLARAPSAAELNAAQQQSAAGALDEASLTLSLLGSSEYKAFVQPVVAVYDAFVGRLPDAAGLQFWVDSLRYGESLGRLIEGFLGSGEFAGLAQSSNNAFYVGALYDRVLGRSADSQGQAYWTDLLERGVVSRKDMALSFLQSTESATTLQASGAFAQSYVALRAAKPEVELTLAEVDAARGASVGSIFGTKIVSESLYQAILQRAPSPSELASDNAALALGLLTEAELAAKLIASPAYINLVQPVIAMYDAFMGRLPDAFGLAYWSGLLRAGSTQESVVSGFLNSGEYGGLSQSASNKLFVDTLYARVLGREPDEAGSAYWVEQIATGQASREAVAVSFLKSGESASSPTASNALANAYVLLRGAGLGDALTPSLVDQARGATVAQLLSAKVGVVADGYLAGATVWVDADNDGVKDPGERSVLTDTKGAYLSFGEAHPVVATGGTDIATGLSFLGQLSAPAGALVVNPITTLVEKLTDRGLSVESAQDYVAKALSLNLAGTASLLSTDWLASTSPLGFAAQTSAVQVANLMRVSAALVPAHQADELADGIATALAANILSNLNRPLDLQSATLLTQVTGAGLTQAAQSMSASDLAALGQTLASLNSAVASQSAAALASLNSGTTTVSTAFESLAKLQVIGQAFVGAELAQALAAKTPLAEVAAKLDASVLQALGAQVQAASGASGGLALPSDKAPPTVAASDLVMKVAAAGLVPSLAQLTVQFSEPVYGLELSDFEITNAKATSLERLDALNYRLELSADAQVEGEISVKLKAGAVSDSFNNVSLAPPNALGNTSVDTKPPSLTVKADVSSATVPGAPVSAATALPIRFTLSFSEPIQSLSASDIKLSQATAGEFRALDAKTYELVATPNKDYSGDVVLTLAQGAVKDLKGNTLSGTPSQSVAVDTKAPTLVVSDNVSDSATNPMATGLPVVFRLTFSEAVYGLTLDDLSVTGGDLSKLTALSSTQWEVTATPQADFLGDLALSLKAGAVTDALGNALAGSVSASQRIDSKAPAAALSDTANGLATGQVALRIAFDEPVTGLTATDLSLVGARLDSFTQLTATVWQALVTPLASAGTPAGVLSPGTSADAQLKGSIVATLPAGAANDAAGNASKAASLSVPFQITNPNPTPIEGGGGGVTPPRNREPFFTSGASASIAENAPSTTTVYTAQAIDNGLVTYRLTGDDASLFTINASSGVIQLKASADFEAKRSYSINVVASDDGGLSSTQAVAVSVIDVAEPPEPLSLVVDRVAQRLSLSFDRDLGGTAPLPSAFSVKTLIGGQATLNPVTAVQISGGTLTLTLGAAFEAGQVDLSYSAPTVDRATTNAAIQSTNGTSGASATGDDANSFNFVKLADGYIRGASIWLDTNRDGTADIDTGIRSGPSGEIFLPPTVGGLSTSSAALIAQGGFNVDTGAINSVVLKAPPGASSVNPLTTLVQSVLEANPNQSTAQAAALVASSLGLDPTINLQSYDPIAVLAADSNASNLSGSQLAAFTAQKAAAQVVALAALSAGSDSSEVLATQAKSAVLGSLASQLVDAAGKGEVIQLASSTVIGKVASAAQAVGATQSASDQAKLADAVSQIGNAASLDAVRSAQASFLDEVSPAAPLGFVLRSPTHEATPAMTVRLDVASTDGRAAVANDLLTIFDGGLPIATVQLGSNDIATGSVIITPSRPLQEGNHTITASLSDQAGNPGAMSSPVPLLIDQTAPAAPRFFTLAADNVVNSGELPALMAGLAEPLAKVELSLASQIKTLQADASGAWQYSLSAADVAALGQGAGKVLSATAIDAAGNRSPMTTQSIAIDTLAPQALATIESVTDNVGAQQGVLVAGATSDDQRLALAGSLSQPLASDELLFLYDGDRLLGTASHTSLSWSITTPALTNGAHSLALRAVDAAGNVGVASAPFALSVQTEAPSTTVLFTSTEGATNNPQPSITGRLSASLSNGDRLLIFNGETLIGDSTGASGQPLGSFVFSTSAGVSSFSFTPQVALSAGSNVFHAAVQNAAGNQGALSASYALLLDTTAPSLQISQSIAEGVTLGPGQVLRYIISADEPITGLSATDVLISGGALLAGSFEALSSRLYRLDVTPDLNSNANLVLSLPSGAASDVVGNGSAPVQAAAISVDTQAPAAPSFSFYALNNAVTADNQISANERAQGVVLQGSAEANSLITLRFGLAAPDTSTRTVSTTASSSGLWTYELSAADYGFLDQGSGKTVMVRASDALGNQSAAAVQSFIIDTQPPALSLIQALSADGTPARSQGAGLPLVNERRPRLSFTLELGASAKIDWNNDGNYDNDGDNSLTGTGLAQSLRPLSDLALGNASVGVRASDALGNTVERSIAFTVDTTPVSVSLTANPNGSQLLVSLTESVISSGANALALADMQLQSASGQSKSFPAGAQLIANEPFEGRAQSFTLLAAAGTLASGDRLTLPALKLADLAGNVPLSNVTLEIPAVDGQPPTLSITSNLGTGASTLVAGQSATLSYRFSEPVKGLGSDFARASFDGKASGTFGPLVGPSVESMGGGNVYIYTQSYTPGAGVDARTTPVTISVASDAYADLADNKALSSSSLLLRVDTRPITVVDAMQGSPQQAIPVTLAGAADGNFLYNINTDLTSYAANALIDSFGPGDKLVFTVAPNVTLASLDQLYSVQDQGVLSGAGTLSLYANSGAGAVQRIVLANPSGNGEGLGNSIDSVTELAQFLGSGAIELNKVLVPSRLQLNETAGNDLINANQGTVLSNAKRFNALNGNDSYVINADVAGASANIRIEGFGLGDQLLFDIDDPARGLSALSAYAVSDNLSDITIYANVAGSVQRIVLVGLSDGAAYSRSPFGGSVDSLEELFAFLGQSGPGVI